MNILNKTIFFNKKNINKKWLIINAESQILGRLASQVASLIKGKHKVNFTPNTNCGDNIIIINASKILITGQKNKQKTYISHTGYPGGQKSIVFEELKKKFPKKIIENAIKRMLTKNKLKKKIFKNLYIYLDNKHPHQAQKPKKIKMKWNKKHL